MVEVKERGDKKGRGKVACITLIALLIASFSPFTFAPVSADVSLQSGKWSDYFLSPNLCNEVVINIINAQSYPFFGENWTVRFNTTGQANLKITPDIYKQHVF